MDRRLLVSLAALTCGIAFSAHSMVTTTPVRVTKIQVYPDYGGGDVTFQVDATIAGCNGGFWLAAADDGFKQAYAALLMVKAGMMPIVVYADETQLWTASGDQYCRVRALMPE